MIRFILVFIFLIYYSSFSYAMGFNQTKRAEIINTLGELVAVITLYDKFCRDDSFIPSDINFMSVLKESSDSFKDTLYSLIESKGWQEGVNDLRYQIQSEKNSTSFSTDPLVSAVSVSTALKIKYMLSQNPAKYIGTPSFCNKLLQHSSYLNKLNGLKIDPNVAPLQTEVASLGPIKLPYFNINKGKTYDISKVSEDFKSSEDIRIFLATTQENTSNYYYYSLLKEYLKREPNESKVSLIKDLTKKQDLWWMSKINSLPSDYAKAFFKSRDCKMVLYQYCKLGKEGLITLAKPPSVTKYVVNR